jgi:hypothetical protein
MRRAWSVPILVLGGLSAVAVCAVHGGPDAVSNARWLAVCLIAALVSASGLALAADRLLDLRRRFAAVSSGRMDCGRLERPAALPLSVLAAASIACQGASHLALLGAGVSDHSGAVATPCLHVLAGFAVALLVRGVDRVLTSVVSRAVDAIVRAILLLLAAASAAPRPRPAGRRRFTRAAPDHHGRAPPLTA